MKMLSNILHKSAAVFCLLVVLVLPGTAFADDEEPTAGEMLADAVIVRPAMLVVTTVTAATFVVTLPFSLLGGNVDEAAEKLLAEPAKYTFIRPLGEFEEDYDDEEDDE